MNRLSAPTAAALLALAIWTRVAAQAPSIATARLDGSIRLDGVLDEPAWVEATPATRFTQLDPDEGATPTEQTEIRVLLGGLRATPADNLLAVKLSYWLGL